MCIVIVSSFIGTFSFLFMSIAFESSEETSKLCCDVKCEDTISLGWTTVAYKQESAADSYLSFEKNTPVVIFSKQVAQASQVDYIWEGMVNDRRGLVNSSNIKESEILCSNPQQCVIHDIAQHSLSGTPKERLSFASPNYTDDNNNSSHDEDVPNPSDTIVYLYHDYSNYSHAANDYDHNNTENMEPLDSSLHQDPLSPNQDPVQPNQDPVPPPQDLVSPHQGRPVSPHQDPVLPPQDPVLPPQDPVSLHQDPVSPHQDSVSPHQDPVLPHQDPVLPHQDLINSVLFFEEPPLMVLSIKRILPIMIAINIVVIILFFCYTHNQRLQNTVTTLEDKIRSLQNESISNKNIIDSLVKEKAKLQEEYRSVITRFRKQLHESSNQMIELMSNNNELSMKIKSYMNEKRLMGQKYHTNKGLLEQKIGLLPTPSNGKGLLPTPSNGKGLLPTPSNGKGLLPTPRHGIGLLPTPSMVMDCYQQPVMVMNY